VSRYCAVVVVDRSAKLASDGVVNVENRALRKTKLKHRKEAEKKSKKLRTKIEKWQWWWRWRKLQ